MPRKKWYFAGSVLLITIAFIAGFLFGIKHHSRDHFSINARKSIIATGDQFIHVEGEMAATDFNPGLKLRSVNIACIKRSQKSKLVYGPNTQYRRALTMECSL